MLNLTGATRVFLRAGATDLRLGFNGLHALVESQLKQDVLSGHVFVFCNRAHTRIKALTWDGSGLWICTKTVGARHVRVGMEANTEVAAAQLQALLAGLEVQRQRAWYRR